MNEKLVKLKEWFKNRNGVLVAFSGGVDSALLLKVAHDVLGDRVLAVTANSPLNTPEEKEIAIKVAQGIGAKHLVIEFNDLDNPLVSSNPVERCYYCKKSRFEAMLEIALQRDLETVVEGSNLDDLKDYRPGLKAVKELEIASPLEEVGFTKAEVRQGARELGLSVWNKPSEPCLATRIPFNIEITQEKLKRVMVAERLLKNNLQITQLRVRDHNGLARVEVETKDLDKAFLKREDIVKILKAEGFTYVTMDLSGYRTGSMNQTGGEV
ncbi:MAG: ATP-dependent sacrificial sulfur transferase LarE [Peptococcales bacterium]